MIYIVSIQKITLKYKHHYVSSAQNRRIHVEHNMSSSTNKNDILIILTPVYLNSYKLKQNKYQTNAWYKFL